MWCCAYLEEKCGSKADPEAFLLAMATERGATLAGVLSVSGERGAYS
jgi:hypothetical protein